MKKPCCKWDSLSFGSFNCCATESISIPRKVIMVEGPTVFSSAARRPSLEHTCIWVADASIHTQAEDAGRPPQKRSRPSNGRNSQLSRWALLKPDSQPWLRTTWEQNGGQGEGGSCQCMRFHSIPVPGDVDHPCGQGPAYKHSKCLSLPLRHLSHIECHHLIDCDALHWT